MPQHSIERVKRPISARIVGEQTRYSGIPALLRDLKSDTDDSLLVDMEDLKKLSSAIYSLRKKGYRFAEAIEGGGKRIWRLGGVPSDDAE